MQNKKVKKWSDQTILKALPNPGNGYEVKIECPEVTFLGVYNQPDFATLFMTMYPKNSIIELKSLKLYLQQFREKIISYERLLNVIYEDILETYKPNRLRLVMKLRPRGGISSKLTKDSDWSINGGKEIFKDWIGQRDE